MRLFTTTECAFTSVDESLSMGFINTSTLISFDTVLSLIVELISIKLRYRSWTK